MSTPSLSSSAHAAPATGQAAVSARKARFWDRIATKYAADPIADPAGYEATLRRVQGFLKISDEVLEIGCGTGTTALHLAPFTHRLRATDVSAEMIDIARDKLVVDPLPQLSFEVADADTAVAAPGSQDVVMAFNLLHLVDDLDQALAMAVQTLRPGGLLLAKTPCVGEMNPLITRLALPLMRAVGKAPPVLCFKAPALLAAMQRLGLEVLAVERHGTRQGKDIRLFTAARKPA
ncbi:MAG: class I SAM-dependent methyltransferase [Hydrogenophaga sp.]|uniref:class I SAM-dependent methyltransferase n=1 Tax=Hydrogenophaga sp. TaxID=1904254 RepID=UPI001DD14303|nr:class I SAM-dependent methyltransferase [Hydrogenophaga sp.]MBX3610504.1 class I SAM-dependent methyltransferase [Hydrogenophaga sp.]